MALFRVTMKKDMDGIRSSSGKKVPKGTTFQVISKNGGAPTGKEIAEAIRLQFGIEVHDGNFGNQGIFGPVKVERLSK